MEKNKISYKNSGNEIWTFAVKPLRLIWCYQLSLEVTKRIELGPYIYESNTHTHVYIYENRKNTKGGGILLPSTVFILVHLANEQQLNLIFENNILEHL